MDEPDSPHKDSDGVLLEYDTTILTLMLQEANDYASRLNLPEKLPITTESLKEHFITRESIADRFGALGSIRTSKFTYGFGKGRHLSYITRLVEEQDKSLYERHKSLAIVDSAVNTNAAVFLATNWLKSAYVNVADLSRSSTITVSPIRILNMTTSKYMVIWHRNGRTVAEVVLVEPTKQLDVLRVEDPEYILRPPLVVEKKKENITVSVNKQPGH